MADWSPESSRLLERSEHYRQFAREALYQAHEAQDAEQRAGFVVMAAGWQKMAEEIDRVIAQNPGQHPNEAKAPDGPAKPT